MTANPPPKPSNAGPSGLLDHEAAGGIVMLAAAVVALLIANSPYEGLNEALLGTPVSIRIGAFSIDKPLLVWINDGLMAIFFFLVGLEIKREVREGALSTADRAALPLIGAIGGMALPALIYALITWHDPVALRGWAIPSATDIAFAVGVLTLLGPRVPPALKVFLLALAILDDLSAILIIAVFYTEKLSMTALALAGLACGLLAILNRMQVTRIAPYALGGLFLWACVLKSGVHATLAGALAAVAIPLKSGEPSRPSPLATLEEGLNPWVTFGVLPVFALANAGVSLYGLKLVKLLEPIPVGIALGLVVGKPLGITGALRLGVASGLVRLPEGVTWRQMAGVGALGGIGFTMSLFIGMLAFGDAEHAVALRAGVILGSLISALAGYTILRRANRATVA